MRIASQCSPQGWIPLIRVTLLLLIFAVAGARVQAARFSATLDRSTIAAGESATLSLVFEGEAPDRLPTFQIQQGLTLQPLGPSREFTIINGQTSSRISFNYLVKAAQPGDYVIPPIKVQLGNQTFTSQQLHLRVTKSSAPTALAFLKLIPSKETVYVGEVFPVEIQLYLGARQDSLQMPQIEGDGFVFGRMPPLTQSNTQIGNQMYTVGTFRLSATAVKTGKLTLGPAQCSLILHVPMGRSRSLFDDFFGGGVQRKPVSLTSEPVTVSVLPLPTENRPATFNGAVGDFSIAANASPTNVTAGDPITLRLQIAGTGNLDSLSFPAGADWPDFKVYSPTSKIEPSDPLGISGVKTFECVVIPQKSDIKELPQVRFSFFDPEKKSYRTVEHAPIPITVRKGEHGQPQPTVFAGPSVTDSSEPAPRDIVHIKPYLGTVSSLPPPLITRSWFLAMHAVPVCLWLGARLWRKRRESLERNPQLRRRIAVTESVRRGLKKLSQLAAAQSSDEFFALVFRLLQEQLGERLDLPSSAITEAVIDERLKDRAPESLVNKLHSLFQLCNQARYAPHRSTQELMAIVPEVEETLSALRALPDQR